MSLASESVEQIFAQHKNYTIKYVLEHIRSIWQKAENDADTAELLAKTANRFTQCFKHFIGIAAILKFVNLRPKLLEHVIKNWNLHAQDVEKIKRERLKAFSEWAGRSQLIALYNPKVQQNSDNPKELLLNHDGALYPIATRNTRNFNRTLFSVGSSENRELLKLNPLAPRLLEVYEDLKSSISSSTNVMTILCAIKKLSRSLMKSHDIDFVRTPANQNRCIQLDEFIIRGVGVCRHHTLLNAYLLSRLVEDGYLDGEVIHHRQSFTKDAHTWNLFINKKDGKIYSLDSVNNHITILTDHPGVLDKFYKNDVESVINERFRSATIQPDKNDSPVNAQEFIQHIKDHIEQNTFEVGSFLFFQGGVDITIDGACKRVPHRVGEIYKLINKTIYSADKKLQLIKEAAQDAIDNPRPMQAMSTREFYNMVITNHDITTQTGIHPQSGIVPI